ncbi:MAG: PPC domain-containing protein [Chloroflexi bacterium]|nr:PPC domain-containing protein [Chloroflexota bacterium]
MTSPSRRFRRPLLVASILTSLLVGGPSAGLGGLQVVKAADPSADIPGIPLPGAIAAGRLGGAIYDVVYNLTVAPGYVIVASLNGTPGTDFDLYLFDSSATSVLSNVGLLTKSIGSTSTESISWPSRSGGTYYIDLNGATDLEGDYRLTVQTVPDPTPPVVSASLAGGSTSTNQLTVPVTLTASDDLSGVAEMAFSGDGTTYTDWQPFSRDATWTFGAGDGLKTLWVKVRNGVGLESAPARTNVTLDTVSPSAISIVPAPGTTVVGLRPRFSVAFE